MNRKKLLIIIAVAFVFISVLILLLLSLKKAAESPEKQPFTNSYQQIRISPTQPIVNKEPDLLQAKAAKEHTEDTRIHRPDIFLSNLLPYQAENFSVKTGGGRNDHIFFIVTLNKDSQALAKINFFDWLRAKGLSDDQTPLLDIEYSYQ